MSNHYVYLLQHRDTGMSYIGSRTCKCRIGSDKYMGSSSAMTQEDKAGCNKIIFLNLGGMRLGVSAQKYMIRLLRNLLRNIK